MLLNFNSIAQTILTVLGVIGVVGIAFTYFKAKGTDEANSLNQANILALKEALEITKTDNLQLREQINNMRQDLGKLEGTNIQLQKQLEEYMKLLGPAGELMVTLKLVREAITDNSKVAPMALQFMDDVRTGKLQITPSPIQVEAKVTNK